MTVFCRFRVSFAISKCFLYTRTFSCQFCAKFLVFIFSTTLTIPFMVFIIKCCCVIESYLHWREGQRACVMLKHSQISPLTSWVYFISSVISVMTDKMQWILKCGNNLLLSLFKLCQPWQRSACKSHYVCLHCNCFCQFLFFQRVCSWPLELQIADPSYVRMCCMWIGGLQLSKIH